MIGRYLRKLAIAILVLDIIGTIDLLITLRDLSDLGLGISPRTTIALLASYVFLSTVGFMCIYSLGELWASLFDFKVKWFLYTWYNSNIPLRDVSKKGDYMMGRYLRKLAIAIPILGIIGAIALLITLSGLRASPLTAIALLAPIGFLCTVAFMCIYSLGEMWESLCDFKAKWLLYTQKMQGEQASSNTSAQNTTDK